MKFTTTLATLLSATGLASAAPAWESEPSGADTTAALNKRAWPSSLGDCYGSGQWGKQEEGKRAIRDFCTRHGNGQIPPRGNIGQIGASGQPFIQDIFSYNSVVEWKIKVQTKPTTSLGNQLTYEECIICLYRAIDYCWGNNQDTRYDSLCSVVIDTCKLTHGSGGEGIVRTYRVAIDPNTK